MNFQELLRDDEMLAWVWAVKDQWHLYYQHDAMWIDCAARGWRGADEDQFHSFLKAYGLLRGEVGKKLGDSAGVRENDPERGRRNRRTVIEVCNCLCTKAEKVDREAAGQIWKELRKQISDRLSLKVIPASVTMKAFWFYRPGDLPMYDQYALNGLIEKVDGSRKTELFISEFYKFFDENEKNIDGAQAIVGHPYPYKYRIAEKFLWLKGNKENRKTILNRFKTGLENAQVCA